MTHAKITDNMRHTLSLGSRKQLLEQLRSEQQDVNAITQPLLETEAGFIKNLDHYLTHRDTLDLRKSKLLYKRWTQKVWLPVQRSITQHFTHHGYDETLKMRMHAQYINYCNAKGFVFLETYDPLEYNPFLHHFNTPRHHKISTPTLEDPLSLQSRARIKEKTAVLHCQTGHVYRRQQVEEILQGPPASQQSRKPSQVKSSRDSRSQRLFSSRSRGSAHAAVARDAASTPSAAPPMVNDDIQQGLFDFTE